MGDLKPNKIDKLFALEAVIKELSEERDMLKAECAEELLSAYEANGDTQRRSVWFGKGAGCFSVSFSKAKPGVEVVEYNLADKDAFGEWLDSNPLSYAQYILDNASDFAQKWFEETGELPEGIARVAYMTADEPEHVSGTRLSVKKDAIIDVLMPQLPTAITGLLED